MLIPGIRLVDRPGVLYFVDGRRVVALHGDDEIRSAIRSTLSDKHVHVPGEGADEIHALLDRLEVCTEGPRTDVPLRDVVSDAVAFASAATGGWTTPALAADRIGETTVYVWADEGSSLRTMLVDSGLLCEPLPWVDDIARLDPALSIVAAVASAIHPATSLSEINTACLANGIAWLPIGAYDGAVAHIGPLMIPGETACFDCLLRRLAANVEYSDVYRDVVADAPSAPTPPGLRLWCRSVASLVLLRWITTRDPRLPGRLFSLLVDDLRVDQSTVFRVPRCRACDAPDYVGAAAPWEPGG